MPKINTPLPSLSGDVKKDVIELYDNNIMLRKELTYLLSHLDQDNIYRILGNNASEMWNRDGINPAFIKWFKNMCWNSSFEVFDTSNVPANWDDGVSNNASNFYGTYSLKLTAGQTSTQKDNASAQGLVNPQWYNDVSIYTRVSFHKKGGAVKISVLDGDSADAPYTLEDEDGNTGAYIEYANNANWIAESYTVSFAHAASTEIKVKFENSDGADDAYIDSVIIEPDFTDKFPSSYSDGPYSIGTINGRNLLSMSDIALYVQTTAPTDAIAKDVWIDTDDYTRYDKKALIGTATLSVSDNEFITASGTFTITLHAGTTAGITKYIYNIGTGLVTLSGTINGTANILLYPNDSVKLMTDGTNWRY